MSSRATKIQKQVRTEMLENRICAAVGQKLQDLYPGWSWLVECTWQSGVVTVKNMNFGGEYGFVLHLAHLSCDPDLDLVMRAGGEILERCGYAAGPRPERVEAKRDFKGNVIGDLHGAA